ncbi:MAG: TonB-dependent receptor [Marinifilaceae bacterium]|jgi:outer membrane receptor for ferrienterochelin and colicins|nr:TonB-dependent receptor [Marinifilaceae bacterium]
MKKFLLGLVCLLIIGTASQAANKHYNGKVVGKILCNGEGLPFMSVWIKGTTLGSASDEHGHFSIENIPDGTYVIEAQGIGYTLDSKTISIKNGKEVYVKLELKEDAIGLNQIVVTADRNARDRREAPVVVSTLSPQLMVTAQAEVIGDGLNFCPGLRMENNCQNCGFSQVRMNGMEGAYSQILINSRPIFSGLAGVYGLEMIPTNMIERIEITRGGGSAIFGSNAIAGTINLITKDPINNSYQLAASNSIIGVGHDGGNDTANDYNLNFNTSIVSENGKTGMTIFGFYRDKGQYDANNDGFSETAKIKNSTVGTRIFHKIGMKSKIVADFYHIKENRRGGNKFGYVEHEADIAESLRNEITTGSVNYDMFFSEASQFSIYASGQKVNRNSYYGAERQLDAYGYTKDFTYNTGAQYKGTFSDSKLVAGLELTGGNLEDTKLGYYDTDTKKHTTNKTIADQKTRTLGGFAQYEYKFDFMRLSAGARYDNYLIEDNTKQLKDVKGNVFSPRINLLFDVMPNLQFRLSYSQGYRAPQIFDEDLHVETSGARKIIHKNDKDLKQETSYSYISSIDYTLELEDVKAQFLAEAFYTELKDAFVNDISAPDANKTVTYTRMNAKDGAKIKGINLEFNLALMNKVTLKSGFTIQESKFGSNSSYNQRKFVRTPDNYGFFSIDYDITKSLCFALTGNYTGKMLVPYHGENFTKEEISNKANSNDGVLRESDNFFDLGCKVRYNFSFNETKVELYTGMKNIFDSFQSDFDRGVNRDPGYNYGPMNPRIFYFGIKIGNFL